jgi:hypothetical protein
MTLSDCSLTAILWITDSLTTGAACMANCFRCSLLSSCLPLLPHGVLMKINDPVSCQEGGTQCLVSNVTRDIASLTLRSHVGCQSERWIKQAKQLLLSAAIDADPFRTHQKDGPSYTNLRPNSLLGLPRNVSAFDATGCLR